MTCEQIEYLPLDLIVATMQVRKEFCEESLEGLRDTLLSVGQLAPIRVRKEGDLYVLVQGERRYRAAKLAGMTAIAAIVERQELSPAAVLHRQLVENCQRDDLKPMEVATAIKALMQETGWTASEIAAKLGMSAATVSRLLAMTELPTAIQARIESGDIPASTGYELSRVADPAEQAKLAEQVIGGELTRDAISGIVRSNDRSKGVAATSKPARFKADLGAGRSIVVAGGGLDNPGTLIAWLEELLGKVRKLRPKGQSLATIARQFRDEAQT